MKNSIIAISLFFIASCSTLDPEVVNKNFQAIVNAVNDLDVRVKTLEPKPTPTPIKK